MDSNKCNITVQPARLMAAERIMQWQPHLLALHAARTVQPTYSVAWPLDAWGACSGIELSKVYVRPHGLRTGIIAKGKGRMLQAWAAWTAHRLAQWRERLWTAWAKP